MEATEDTGFQEKTLRGDVQNRIMDEVVRPMPGWTKMSEREQKAIIAATERLAADIVRESVKIVAHRDFPHMVVSLGKWTVKEGIKLEVTASENVEEIVKLAGNGGKQAMLVFASVAGFMGSRAEPQADKDQPDLPMDGQPAHDPETGEVLDDGDAGDGNPLPESQPLPEMSNDDIDTSADGDGEGDDEGEADEQPDEQPEEEPAPPPRGSRSRRRALADADA